MSVLQLMAIAVPAALSVAAVVGSARADAPGTGGGGPLPRLEAQRIFFGHQSVGKNLLDGLAELGAADGARLRIVETRDPAALVPGVLAHAYIGANGDPLGKLADFEKALDAGMAGSADVALMKFCYVDFTATTDASALFRRYQAVLAGLQRRHPTTRFVHVTVPLTTVQSGKKAMLKKLLGRPLDGVAENARREEYNALLRSTYRGVEPIFDLALAESTWPDGRAETALLDGKPVPALVPAYTDDGGHLLPAARQRIAQQLAGVLAAPR
jgi:hypothetical protein